MIRDIISHIIRFVLLVLLQVLVVNEIENLPFFINPQVYVLFLLLLPINTPLWLALIVGLVTGFTIDKFSGTLGMHMAASVLMVYVRYFFIRATTELEMHNQPIEPGIAQMGFKWFLPYAASMVLIHHIMLFFVEIFSFREFFATLLRALSSSAVTLLLILLIQFLFYRNSYRRNE